MTLESVWMLTQVLIDLLSIDLCAKVPGKATEDGLSIWVPASHVGDKKHLATAFVLIQPWPLPPTRQWTSGWISQWEKFRIVLDVKQECFLICVLRSRTGELSTWRNTTAFIECSWLLNVGNFSVMLSLASGVQIEEDCTTEFPTRCLASHKTSYWQFGLFIQCHL